jgi:hypothetical protein
LVITDADIGFTLLLMKREDEGARGRACREPAPRDLRRFTLNGATAMRSNEDERPDPNEKPREQPGEDGATRQNDAANPEPGEAPEEEESPT